MKGLYLILFLTFAAYVASAQDAESFKILPFNQEEFQKRTQNPFQIDTMHLQLDTLSFLSENLFPMRIIKPPLKEIAPMPNMPIRDDIHYHMKIKDYANCYAPTKPRHDDRKLPEELLLPSKPSQK